MSTPASAHTLINAALAKAFAPRKALTVSEWADAERHLSKKGSAEPGPWRTERNPPLREPMDALSGRSTVRDVVLMFPIQFGKALALDTPIPTPNGYGYGWTTMGEIKAGDRVIGANGDPATVLLASEIFENHPCYRLAFSDGTSIVADAGHHWWVIDTESTAHGDYATTHILTTETLAANTRGMPQRYAIPLTTNQSQQFVMRVYITHIEPIPSVPTRCIAVDNADHLYLAGLGMIPTHNTEIAANTLGYTMAHNPGPVMVCLPGEVSMHKWVNQKLNPMIEETPAVAGTLDSLKSRDASNTKTFKDFAGGQLYLEHAGSPSRLKSTSVRTLIVDELDEFANNFSSGDDPLDMLLGRTSAFPTTHKRLFISTPGIQGISRTEELWQKSDQRRYYITCPHCGHEQHLEWTGLKWSAAAQEAWYVCADCGVCIEEHHKTDLIRNGRWIAAHPERKLRGYHINCLYYQIGLGPRWNELARMWLDCQNDPARLKTFINDRLAEPWEDRSTRLLKLNIIADRAEDYRLREAPNNVLTLTAGVDTQDNRLAVQIVGWGKGFTCWILDYVELMGDPAEDDVWLQLTDLINRPIERADGTLLSIQATAIDAGGHRTEAVKAYCRIRHIRRPMAIFGAVPNNAPVLSRPKFQEIKWRNTTDKKGVIQHVGTVAIKNVFFSWLSVDGDAEPEKRRVHFSKDLDRFYFEGVVSETFDPRSNRYVKKRGARNEPLDTWVYAYAAAHHSELRYHTYTQARWDALADSLKPRTAASPMIQQSPDTPTRSASTSQKQLTPYYIPD